MDRKLDMITTICKWDFWSYCTASLQMKIKQFFMASTNPSCFLGARADDTDSALVKDVTEGFCLKYSRLSVYMCVIWIFTMAPAETLNLESSQPQPWIMSAHMPTSQVYAQSDNTDATLLINMYRMSSMTQRPSKDSSFLNTIYLHVKNEYHSDCVYASKAIALRHTVLYVYQWQCTPPCQIQAGPTRNKKRELPALPRSPAVSSSLWNIRPLRLRPERFPVGAKCTRIPATYGKPKHENRSTKARAPKV